MRIHRLMAILLLIESRGQIKAKELAEALETSTRTIHRDIEALCEAGIPIMAAPGPHGGISLMKGYSSNMNRIHGEDMISLFLSGTGIHPDENSEAGLKLKQALLKLEKTLPTPYAQDIRIAKERFYFDPAPWWHEKKEIPFLDTLRKAVWQSRKLRLCYLKVNGQLSTRIVHPYGLVVKSLMWYLVAYCETSHETRIFKCERITEAKPIDEAFPYPDCFSLEAFWKEHSNQFKDTCEETEQYPVRIKLPTRYASLLNTLSIIHESREQDMIFATINLHKLEFAREDVLDLIGKAEILEPYELRVHVKDKIRELLKNYQ